MDPGGLMNWYLGMRVKFHENGDISMDQDQYLKLATGANLYSSYGFSGGLTQNYGIDKKFQARTWYQNVSFDKSNAGSCYLDLSKLGGTGSTRCGTTGLVTGTPPGKSLHTYVSSHDDNPYTELGSSWMFSKDFQNFSSLQFSASFIATTSGYLVSKSDSSKS